MKKLSFYFSILILIVLVGFNSCTIEKRSYQPGYYVDWHNANRKSKTNAEIELKKGQETVCEEKIVEENNVKKIEDSIQPIAIQDIEPVYASNDENTNHIEIINSTKQKNNFSTNTTTSEYGVYESVIKKKTLKSSDLTIGSIKLHRFAVLGLVLSILSVCFFAYFIWLGFLCSIAGLIISKIVFNKTKSNPEEYTKTRKIAKIGLIISAITFISKILLYSFVMILLFNMHVE